MFKPAVKSEQFIRLALVGPTGAGKTKSALLIAQGLGQRIAVIDTERGSAALYADEFHFDSLELADHHPARYIEAIRAAEDAGYDVLIIDSLSHAWAGQGGALEIVDKRKKGGNSFTAWADVTPLQNQLVAAIIGARLHIIATMRAKTEWVLETDARGKQVPRKIGTTPVQRDQIEYEFTVCADIDIDHVMTISKTRCSSIDGQSFPRPDQSFGRKLLAWLQGSPAPQPKAFTPTPAPKPANDQPEAPAAPKANGGFPEEIRAYILKLWEGSDILQGLYPDIKIDPTILPAAAADFKRVMGTKTKTEFLAIKPYILESALEAELKGVEV